MPHILPKLRNLERRDDVNGGNVTGGNQDGGGNNSETNIAGNGGTIDGDATGDANGGSVTGGNQDGGGNNSETNIGGNEGNGGDGGNVTGGNQDGGGNNTETNFGGNGETGGNVTGGNQDGGSNTETNFGGNGGNTNINGNVNSGSTVPQASEINPPSSDSSKGALIGGVVGGLIGLLILTALLVYYFKRRFRRNKKNPLNNNNITAFDASQYRSIEPRFPTDTKLHSLPDLPSITSVPSPSRGSSDSLANSMNVGGQRNTREFVNLRSQTNTLLQRDSTEDQLTSLPSQRQPLQGLSRSFSILSDNPSNLNPLLREILNSRNGDSGDGNIQIFIINDPSNVEGLATTSDSPNSGEIRGRLYHGRLGSSSRNINLLPPSYESE